jgi:hypothetical protein
MALIDLIIVNQFGQFPEMERYQSNPVDVVLLGVSTSPAKGCCNKL